MTDKEVCAHIDNDDNLPSTLELHAHNMEIQGLLDRWTLAYIRCAAKHIRNLESMPCPK